MPTYEYQCQKCGHRFEKFQSITAAPIKECPSCGKNAAQRLISGGAGLIFKGSGFYITDYRDSSYKEKAKSESSNGSKPAESTGAAASAGGESKPAATESKPKGEPKPAAKAESKPAKPGKSS